MAATFEPAAVLKTHYLGGYGKTGRCPAETLVWAACLMRHDLAFTFLMTARIRTEAFEISTCESRLHLTGYVHAAKVGFQFLLA